MKLHVDQPQRLAKKRAHTATHLLHAALQNYIPTTQQAGSLVDDDFLRFDFQAKDALTHEQIQTIEKQINTLIINAHPVKIEEMAYKDAIALGAKAFFEDKYGDVVRVVQILDGENHKSISIELCGGTHVSNTTEIGAFKILSQEAVASGIRRISAVTGPQVAFHFQQNENTLGILAQKLECTPKQMEEKLEKILKEKIILQAQNESLMNQYMRSLLKEITPQKTKSEVEFFEIAEQGISLRELANHAKTVRTDKSQYMLYTKDGNYILFSSHNNAKSLQQQRGIQGGGNESVVQGKDIKVLEL